MYYIDKLSVNKRKHVMFVDPMETKKAPNSNTIFYCSLSLSELYKLMSLDPWLEVKEF